MRKNITRAAIAGAAATTMLLGAAGAAVAAPTLPGPLGEIAGAAQALVPGQRLPIGEEISQGGVYTASLFKQVMGGQNVVQGEKITLRVEVVGGKSGLLSEARVQAVTDVMPAGFQIDSVVVNLPGGEAKTLTAEQYTSVEREGKRDTRVDFNNNGMGRIHIGQGSLSVDFTYVAPEQTGWNQTGAGMEVSAAGGYFAHSTKVDEGGPSVNVTPRPIIDIPGLPGGGDNNSSGSIDWGSLNSGSSN
ncbi:hypothetical protein ACFWGD_10890 [Corynebacterium sp. NPDC060344]|uniref:hypothetical protein n=1 Tax=Corynebacterium sp. NPDC060344 TaxID=3347101 RepID=UPI0036668C2A